MDRVWERLLQGLMFDEQPVNLPTVRSIKQYLIITVASIALECSDYFFIVAYPVHFAYPINLVLLTFSKQSAISIILALALFAVSPLLRQRSVGGRCKGKD